MARQLSVLLLYPFPSETENFSPSYLRLAALTRFLAERQVHVRLVLPEARKPVAFTDLRIDFFPPAPALANLEAISAGLLEQEAYQGFTKEELRILLQFQIYKDYPNPQFFTLLDQAIAQVDAVLLEHPFWASFIAPLCQKHGKPLILTLHEALHLQGAGKGRKMILAREAEAIRAASHVFFARAEDREAFGSLAASADCVANPLSAEDLTSVEGSPVLPKVFSKYGEVLGKLTGAPAPALGKRRLCYVDQHLRFSHGHYANFARAFSQAAARAGIPFRALGHLEIEPAMRQEIDARPIFHITWHSPRVLHPEPATPRAAQLLHQYTLSNIRYHNDLAQALPQEVGVNDLLFLASAEDHQILGACWLIESWPALMGPETVLMFLRYPGDQPFGAHSIEALQQAARHHRIRIGCDCNTVADRFRAAVTAPIEVLPIPLCAPDAAAPETPRIPPRQPGRIRFITLGDPRPEKGVHLLAIAFAALARLPEFERMEFAIQALLFRNPVIEAIQKMAFPNVLIVASESLSEAEYQSFLQSADVVLLPYDIAGYANRTSGVFVEALTCGKPVIVTEGTWMSGELGDSGAGLRIAPGNATSLAEAITTAVRTLPELQEKARVFQKHYRQFHHPDTMIRLLMRIPEKT